MTEVDGIAVRLTGAAPAGLEAGLLALPVFEDEGVGAGTGLVAELDRRLGGHLLSAARAERFGGKAGEQLLVSTMGRVKPARVLLLGLGARAAAAGWVEGGAEPLRVAMGKAAKAARGGTLAAALPSLAGLGVGQVAALARAAVEGALLGAYRFTVYKAAARKAPALTALTLAVPAAAARSRQVADAVALAGRLVAAVTLARDLVNLGPAECTPTTLADAALRVARRAGLRCQVRGPRQIAALRMGLFQGVTRGSVEPPRLVTLSWIPKGAAARKRPVVLVGKAITFDSGGLSLKPSDSMITMNTDMAGSAAVIAAMSVIAAEAPPFPVHGVFGACENMPSGAAYKPSDVLTASDGQTVEITNTDAEGRLVLGDVLAWSAATWKPAALVDVATLTGACMVALGMTTAGLMGPDGPVVEGLLAAARRAGEEAWRLPLTESLADNLKSERADLKNAGDRMGGAMSAALFLQKFVGKAPWAHLDIAGPSHAPKERGYVAAGGTGYAVRTLVEFVRGWEG
ncbi:MAG: leucyl aminopeptidase [Anaeromyxobacter sp.]|nr:leucyl aminopeptidase [Anaeromyxobacter sp.]MBL0275299.1 leucyl aminopeptidase [Anaeromyxobacter sp.]